MVKLIGVTLLFMSVLVVATGATTQAGLRQTEQRAVQRSAEGLRAQGSGALLQLAAREAQLANAQLLQAASLSAIAAEYMAAASPAEGVISSGGKVAWMVNTAGSRYDANPARLNDLFVPSFLTDDAVIARRVRDSTSLERLLPSLIDKAPDVAALYYVSPEGLTRYVPAIQVADLVPADLDVPSQPTFQVAAPAHNPERRTIWTPPYLDDADNGPLVTASTPVYFGDEFQGVIGMDLSLMRLINRLELLRPTPSSHALLWDGGGTLIAASPDAVGELLGAPPTSPSSLGAFGRNVSESKSEVANVLAGVRGGRSGLTTFRLDGRDYFLAHAPLPDLGWTLALAAPLDELTAQSAMVASAISQDVRQTLRGTLTVIAGLFGLALLGVVATSRWLTGPIAELVGGTQRVARGDLDVVLPVRSGDEIGAVAHSFNQMTRELRVAHEQLEQRVAERTEELASLLEVSRSIASTLELEPLLGQVLEQLRRVLPHAAAAIYLRERDDYLNLMLYQGPTPAKQLPGGWSLCPLYEGRVPLDQLIAEAEATPWAFGREVIFSGQPVIVEDVQADTPLARTYRQHATRMLDAVPSHIGSWMGVPLIYRDRVIGMLGFEHGEAGFYTGRHARLALAFASHAAIAIENARLYGQAQQLASLQERQKLARELHDSVSQALYGIALGARTARAQLDSDPARAQAPLEYVLDLAKAGMAEMRALIFELRPESLEQEGLVGALTKHIEALQARHGLQAVCEPCEEPDVPYATKEVLYRVAQEALHNTVKHAQATRVTVHLRQEANWLRLEIRDNGRGFDPTADYAGHLGLVSMRERVERLGGHFGVDSTPGEGTWICVHVPL